MQLANLRNLHASLLLYLGAHRGKKSLDHKCSITKDTLAHWHVLIEFESIHVELNHVVENVAEAISEVYQYLWRVESHHIVDKAED